MEMRDLEFNEVACQFTLVSSNAVLRKVEMNQKNYLIYHNRKTNLTTTIKKIINGPDLVNSWTLEGSDSRDGLYWLLKLGGKPLADDSAVKYGYVDLLNRRQKLGIGANPFILFTTLK